MFLSIWKFSRKFDVIHKFIYIYNAIVDFVRTKIH